MPSWLRSPSCSRWPLRRPRSNRRTSVGWTPSRRRFGRSRRDSTACGRSSLIARRPPSRRPTRRSRRCAPPPRPRRAPTPAESGSTPPAARSSWDASAASRNSTPKSARPATFGPMATRRGCSGTTSMRAYLGEDGLAGTGISLYRAFGGLGVHELTAQLTRSESDNELFGGSGRPTYLVHLLNFWQLTRSTYAQVGGTALYGTNPESSLRTKVGGIDFRLTWRPPAEALYREWTLRGELYALRKEYAGAG